jgi:hypothetical protein
MDNWYPVQVKQQDKAGRPDIDAFEIAMNREKRTKDIFVSFAYTADALKEISAFFKREGKVIIPLTVREILDEEIAIPLWLTVERVADATAKRFQNRVAWWGGE